MTLVGCRGRRNLQHSKGLNASFRRDLGVSPGSVDNPVCNAIPSVDLLQWNGQARFAYIFSIGARHMCAPYVVVLHQEIEHPYSLIGRGIWLFEMRTARPRLRFVKTYAQTPH